MDPQSNAPYGYKKTGNMSFELCAEFNKPLEAGNVSKSQVMYPEPMGGLGDNWAHEVGEKCFSRSIDPELYPVRPK